jgi:hypothetical protein
MPTLGRLYIFVIVYAPTETPGTGGRKFKYENTTRLNSNELSFNIPVIGKLMLYSAKTGIEPHGYLEKRLFIHLVATVKLLDASINTEVQNLINLGFVEV